MAALINRNGRSDFYFEMSTEISRHPGYLAALPGYVDGGGRCCSAAELTAATGSSPAAATRRDPTVNSYCWSELSPATGTGTINVDFSW
ncbi:hypothetical protein JOB18_030879 [Solea senegalensis]|uniref:Uncharacterized protein n=1 Tax=Solea senegalensis TaxID=28829 RepID=A0AAV6QJG2_SOLSE|nr:hypothetical protein JOB18_030879 [Solea senegalensis]